MESAYIYVRVSTDEQKKKVTPLLNRKSAFYTIVKQIRSKSKGYSAKTFLQKTLTGPSGRNSSRQLEEIDIGHRKIYCFSNGIALAGTLRLHTK